MSERALFLALLGVNGLILLLQIQGLSIGYHEAQILYGDVSPLRLLISSSLHIFGQNDYALRIPMIVLHLISVVFLYAISKYYVSHKNDRLWIALIYVLLPGVTSAALIVDNAGLMIVLLFLFIYLYLRFSSYALFLTPLLIWIDPAFAYLFVAITLFGIVKKDYLWAMVGFLSLIVSLSLYGIRVGGVPEGRFLDLLGIYAAIFSPIVFVYLFYVLYRRTIAKEWDLIWIIASSAFLISMLLSFRQKVDVQTFAPFLLVSLPIVAQTFLTTYRIRLREFRSRYQILFYTAFILLLINTLAVFFNQWFYRLMDDPTKHFSYPMHVVKELSAVLHHENIHCIDTGEEKLQLRLRFYGIGECYAQRLEKKPSKSGKKVTISYKNKPVFIEYVTIVNK